jgi:mycofactocin system glycosyltransferase
MNGLSFAFSKDTYLDENSRGYFLESKAPFRSLRVNRSLFATLKIIQTEGLLKDIKDSRLITLLLTLTHKGYLRLAEWPVLEIYPMVSIIIPVRGLSQDLIECLDSLQKLDYPPDKLEIMVVEDGTLPNIPLDLSPFNVKVLKMNELSGPASARNAGARVATGEVLAFLDADCMADPRWLKEIVPFLQIEGIGAVGGFVDGYYRKSPLDKYEQVSSSLNMGLRLLYENDTDSTFYVPTCNMLVRRSVFNSLDGFKAGWHLGEDVDLCWRLRESGEGLLYLPAGHVAHKHRNELLKMLRRRSDYGSSEAALYQSHPYKRKKITMPLFAVLSFLAALAAILLMNPYPLAGIFLFFGIALIQKSLILRKLSVYPSFGKVVFSILRSHFSFYYFTSFHLIRYYLILLIALGGFWHPVLLFSVTALLLTSIVDFIIRKPLLLYPVYLYFYTLEHLAYQFGVFSGCLKRRYFKSYLATFTSG